MIIFIITIVSEGDDTNLHQNNSHILTVSLTQRRLYFFRIEAIQLERAKKLEQYRQVLADKNKAKAPKVGR